MIYIKNENINPYFNLAAEEYLMENFQEDIITFWRNEKAIIVGKNQNTLQEINLDYVREANIPVVRRTSGGGAVYHDLGNLCFTYIINKKSEFNDYEYFTKPIVTALEKLGVKAELQGRNDLVIDGKKFSGNAQAIRKNKLLHHGTLLFNTDLSVLGKCLNASAQKIESKGVKSVKSRVCNISEYLSSQASINEIWTEVWNAVSEGMFHDYGRISDYVYSEDDIKAINELAVEKYQSWDWNYGYSPKYNFEKSCKFYGGIVQAKIDVQNGIIENIKIYGDFFSKLDIDGLEKKLSGYKHDYQELYQVLDSIEINDYFTNISMDEILQVLF